MGNNNTLSFSILASSVFVNVGSIEKLLSNMAAAYLQDKGEICIFEESVTRKVRCKDSSI